MILNKNILLVFICLALSGCGIFVKKPIPDAIITPKIVNIDKDILLPCKDLLELPNNPDDFILVDILAKNIEIYVDCRNKQNSSIKVIKEFSNIKENK